MDEARVWVFDRLARGVRQPIAAPFLHSALTGSVLRVLNFCGDCLATPLGDEKFSRRRRAATVV
jgi:hypothetical protein